MKSLYKTPFKTPFTPALRQRDLSPQGGGLPTMKAALGLWAVALLSCGGCPRGAPGRDPDPRRGAATRSRRASSDLTDASSKRRPEKNAGLASMVNLYALARPLRLEALWPKPAGDPPTTTPTWQKMSFRGSQGDRIPALWRAASSSRTKRHPAVILGHGHGGSKRGMAAGFGSVFPAQGVHLLSVDHPFQGARRSLAKGDICPPDHHLLVKRWLRAIKDLRRAVAVLRRRPDVDPSRIGYLGFSLGGVFGGLLAGTEPKLAAAVLVAPAGDWRKLAASRSSWKLGWNTALLPRWLRCRPCRRRLSTVDPSRLIQRFSPRPLLVVVGQKDGVIHPAAGKTLYKKGRRGAHFISHPGGHTPPLPVRKKAAKWLLEALQKKPLTPTPSP